MTSLACVLKPNTPYMTCAPASCSLVASSMFASSSKRARSSMITVTSLPACGGFDQRADDGGVAARAIQGLLDRQHLGIVRRLLDEIGDRPETLERVMQQHIAGTQGGEDVAAHLQAVRNARRERLHI